MHRHPYTTKTLNTLNCVVCGKEVHVYLPNSKEENPPENELWKNAVVSSIESGFGSTLDGDVYLITICDSCIVKKREEGHLPFLYNYMFENELSQDLRKIHNKNLHRKMKLKRILDEKR